MKRSIELKQKTIVNKIKRLQKMFSRGNGHGEKMRKNDKQSLESLERLQKI